MTEAAFKTGIGALNEAIAMAARQEKPRVVFAERELLRVNSDGSKRVINLCAGAIQDDYGHFHTALILWRRGEKGTITLNVLETIRGKDYLSSRGKRE